MSPASAARHIAMVFAHDGGWDEILLVAIPLVLIAVMLLVADRRARARERDSSDDD